VLRNRQGGPWKGYDMAPPGRVRAGDYKLVRYSID